MPTRNTTDTVPDPDVYTHLTLFRREVDRLVIAPIVESGIAGPCNARHMGCPMSEVRVRPRVCQASAQLAGCCRYSSATALEHRDQPYRRHVTARGSGAPYQDGQSWFPRHRPCRELPFLDKLPQRPDVSGLKSFFEAAMAPLPVRTLGVMVIAGSVFGSMNGPSSSVVSTIDHEFVVPALDALLAYRPIRPGIEHILRLLEAQRLHHGLIPWCPEVPCRRHQPRRCNHLHLPVCMALELQEK